LGDIGNVSIVSGWLIAEMCRVFLVGLYWRCVECFWLGEIGDVSSVSGWLIAEMYRVFLVW
jgi:hypothetical protein